MSKLGLSTILTTYLNRNCGALLVLGFSAGLPYALLFSSLSMWMREAGISHQAIGFASLIGLVYGFKWVWASLIDQVNLPFLSKLGLRKSYLILSQIMLLTSLLALALIDPAKSLGLFLAVSLLVAFASATQDSVIDAYRLEIAKAKYQAALAASYMTGYRLAILLAGACAIWLAEVLGSNINSYSFKAWSLTYLVMASCLIPVLALSFRLQEPSKIAGSANLYQIWHKLAGVLVLILLLLAIFNLATNLLAGNWLQIQNLLGLGMIIFCGSNCGRLALKPTICPIIDFIKRYQFQAILLLLLIATYRLADTVLGVMANVFYLDLGFSKEQIAGISKVFGLLMTLLGAGIGGILIVRFSVLSVLLWGAILCSVTNLLFYVLNQVGADWQLLIITISFDNLSAGIATSAFVAYLSSLTNLQFSASQYAFLSSIMLLLPRFIGGYSGLMVTKFGYDNFFILTAIMGIPTILLILWQIYRTKFQN